MPAFTLILSQIDTLRYKYAQQWVRVEMCMQMSRSIIPVFLFFFLLSADITSCARQNSGDVDNAKSLTSQGERAAFKQQWLHTQGNRIYQSDGKLWMGRGVNLFDTRGCNQCAYSPANPAEVMRRIDVITDEWKANFIRLDLESYGSADGRTHFGGVLVDSQYLQDITAIVAHASSKPNVYVLVSFLINSTFDEYWQPTAATVPEWKKLAETFAPFPNVIFGICNEPHGPDTPEQAKIVWDAMTLNVNAIRAVEDALGAPHHLIAVQGTSGWSRNLAYYETYPINSDNIVYEVHVYNPPEGFNDLVWDRAKKLPVIIGEFGVWENWMSLDDCALLMNTADQQVIPYTGWAFHWSCGISMLQQTGDACGIGAPFVTNSWGDLMRNHLQAMAPKDTPPTPPAPMPPAPPSPEPTPAPQPPQPPNNGVQQIALRGTAWCLDLNGGNTANGTAVQLWSCNNTPAQAWSKVDGALTILGKCLDDIGFSTADGTPVQIWDCSKASNQMWSLNNDSVQLAGTSKCLQATTLYEGSRPVLAECDNNNPRQRWQTASTPAKSSVQFVSQRDSGKCLDIRGGDSRDGTVIEAWSCNGGGNQAWTWQGGGLQSLGKCLDNTAFVLDSGNPILLYTCDGGASQQWILDNGMLKLAGTQKCLDVGDLQSGTQATLQDCNGSDGQLWWPL